MDNEPQTPVSGHANPASSQPLDVASSSASAVDRLSFAEEPCQPLLRSDGESPFQDSWEAEAYALGNLLVKLNHLSATDWMNLMAESIREAQSLGDPDTGETYYQHWCRSLEQFCFRSGLSNPEEHRQTLELWRRAIANTPHGVPLAIENAFLDHKEDAGPDHRHGNHSPLHPSPLDHVPLPSSHLHSLHHHTRPATPPISYYEPMATQILQPSSRADAMGTDA
ncbi:MAG: nitrile hydratase subunit beta [Cyanobacteria bacterium K_Offshore_surface_m2_239]|nr:nitrile hydratase subunit beta [Cyanobacteria bacterium K_Offshore_surface_m2_239]